MNFFKFVSGLRDQIGKDGENNKAKTKLVGGLLGIRCASTLCFLYKEVL